MTRRGYMCQVRAEPRSMPALDSGLERHRRGGHGRAAGAAAGLSDTIDLYVYSRSYCLYSLLTSSHCQGGHPVIPGHVIFSFEMLI